MRSRCSVARALVLAGLWLASAGVPLALSDAGPHVHYGWGEPIRLRHLYTAGPHGPSSCFLRIHADGAVGCARGQSVHSLVEIRAVALRNVAIKGVDSVRYLCMGADGRMLGLARMELGEKDCKDRIKLMSDFFATEVAGGWRMGFMVESCVKGQEWRQKKAVVNWLKADTKSCSKSAVATFVIPQYSAEDCAFEEEIRPDGYNVYWSKKHQLPVSLSSAKQRQLYKERGFLPLSHFLPMLPRSPTEPENLEDHLESDTFSSALETDGMDPFGIASKLRLVESPSFQK